MHNVVRLERKRSVKIYLYLALLVVLSSLFYYFATRSLLNATNILAIFTKQHIFLLQENNTLSKNFAKIPIFLLLSIFFAAYIKDLTKITWSKFILYLICNLLLYTILHSSYELIESFFIFYETDLEFKYIFQELSVIKFIILFLVSIFICVILGVFIHIRKDYFYRLNIKCIAFGAYALLIWYLSSIGISFWRKIIFGNFPSSNILYFTAIAVGIYSFRSIKKGAQLFALAKRASILNANDIIIYSEKKPILFLRSFKRDADSAPTMESLNKREGRFGYWNIWDYDLWINRREWSLEETICKGIGYTRPVIAIGKPGEKLPKLGAFRRYVDDANWKTVVKEFIGHSLFVCLLIGSSDGLAWETNHLLKNFDQQKVLFLIPPNMDQRMWKGFLKNIKHEYKLAFPAKLENSTIAVFFNVQGEPIIITGDNNVINYKGLASIMEKQLLHEGI